MRSVTSDSYRKPLETVALPSYRQLIVTSRAGTEPVRADDVRRSQTAGHDAFRDQWAAFHAMAISRSSNKTVPFRLRLFPLRIAAHCGRCSGANDEIVLPYAVSINFPGLEHLILLRRGVRSGLGLGQEPTRNTLEEILGSASQRDIVFSVLTLRGIREVRLEHAKLKTEKT